MLQFSCDKTHCIDLRVCPHCEIQRLKEENQRLREALGTREEVQWFAKQMEKKLKENDHKTHWSQCDIQYLSVRLYEEVQELGRELWFYEQNPAPHNAVNVIKECADIANFAMMIADNARQALDGGEE
jgi:hypothetical protein